MSEARIYYSNPKIVIMGDPTNGDSPVIVLRHLGNPSRKEWTMINRALFLCRMKLVGEPKLRPDGLWYHAVEEVGDGKELCH